MSIFTWLANELVKVPWLPWHMGFNWVVLLRMRKLCLAKIVSYYNQLLLLVDKKLNFCLARIFTQPPRLPIKIWGAEICGDFQVFVVSLMNLELFLKLYSDNTVKLNLNLFWLHIVWSRIYHVIENQIGIGTIMDDSIDFHLCVSLMSLDISWQLDAKANTNVRKFESEGDGWMYQKKPSVYC